MNKMKLTRSLISVLALGMTVFITLAQDNIIDEVIWVVGDEAILKSEVEEQKTRAQYEGTKFDGDPYCVIPEQMAIQKLFLHQADLDSIVVSDAQVLQEVEARINYFISQIGSKEKLEEYFSKSLTDIRTDMRQMYREQMIVQQMQNKLMGEINITPNEVRQYYNSLPLDSIPFVPAQVEVQILTLEPPIPPEEIDNVKIRLREFAERVNSGESDFSTLAILYSEDTESAKRGGELGFMGKGQLVSEFANVAFNLSDPKRVSRVVQTEFGYHIIQLIERRGDRLNCRHILLRPRVSLKDKEKALAKLDSLSQEIRLSKISFENAAFYFSADKNTRNNKGNMQNPQKGTSRFELQQLPPEIAKVINKMNVGEISKSFTMMDNSAGKEVCCIVRLKSKINPHKANVADDYLELKAMVQAQKGQKIITDFIKKKQRETYIRINPKWANCEFMYRGWIKK